MRTRKKKSILPIIIVLSIIISGIGIYVKNLQKPVNIKDTSKKEISIEDGTPSIQIAKILKENGVIKNEKYFFFFAKKEIIKIKK